jgi:hypothetical protein
VPAISANAWTLDDISGEITVTPVLQKITTAIPAPKWFETGLILPEMCG